MAETRFVDCNKGREMGCGSFCCRLLVRLDPEQRPRTETGLPTSGFVPKDEDGLCVNFDRDSHLCQVWDQRPQVCREYCCNEDPMLQVAVRESFANIVDLAKKAQRIFIPKEQYVSVPDGIDMQDD